MAFVSCFAFLVYSTTFTPEQFGAKGDGTTDDTAPIQQAFHACAALQASSSAASPCRVELAQSYLAGPLSLMSSNLRLEINGTLRMLPKSRYPAPQSRPFITVCAGCELHDVTLTGGGLVNGGSSYSPGSWWLCARLGAKKDCDRPHLIALSDVTRLEISNLDLQDPANHFIELSNTTTARVHGLAMSADNLSPNTDGINFYGGTDQLLTSTTIANGDDCVSVVSSGDPATPRCVSEPETCRGGSLVVENVTCLGGHGMAIGSVRHGVVENVTFRDIVLTREATSTQDEYASGGTRIKVYPNGTGYIRNIHYENIVYKRNVAFPIQIQGRYCPGGPKTCPPGNTAIKISNVTWRNISGSGGALSGIVGEIECDPIEPCTHLVFETIALSAEFKQPSWTILHASGVAHDVVPPMALNASPSSSAAFEEEEES
jgi:polygalacturonase